MALTIKKVMQLKKPGTYHDGQGLYLQVITETNRSWLYRYSLNHKAHWLGLGAEKDVTIFEARAKAAAAKQQVRSGIDPVAAKKSAQQSVLLAAVKTQTFAECVEGFAAAKAAKWGTKNTKAFHQNMQDYALPKIGKLNVASIDTAHVVQCVQGIWVDKHPTAKNVLRRIEGVLDYATTLKYRSGDNPARYKGHMENVLADVRHQTKNREGLPHTEIGAFMVALRGKEGIDAAALEISGPDRHAHKRNAEGKVVGNQFCQCGLDHTRRTYAKDKKAASRGAEPACD